MRNLLSPVLIWLLLTCSGVNADSAFTPGISVNSQGQLPSMVGGVAPSLIFTQTANVVASTTSETNFLGGPGMGGPGGATIPANGPYVGNTYRLKIGGFTTIGVSVATTTIRVRFGNGATPLASVTTGNLPIGSTYQFLAEVVCFVRSVGVSGSVVCNGDMRFWTTANAAWTAPPTIYLSTGLTPVTVDTTVPNAWQITGQFGSVLNSPTMTVTTGTIEVLF